EDPRLLRGKGEFVDDVRMSGTLHATFLRSPHAHARILSIDPSAALSLAGVHAVFTAADMTATMRAKRLPYVVPNPYSNNPLTQCCTSKEDATNAGGRIAVVIADSRYRAEDALPHVHVEYEPLGAVADCRAAMEGGPLAHLGRNDNTAAEFKVGYGDI